MKKKGISLIVLIVTIIVMIILAAVVVLTITNNNPIDNAKKAVFKEDVITYQDELAMYISNEYSTLQGKRDKKITTKDSDEILNYIKDLKESYKGKFCIIEDQLAYMGNDDTEKRICGELNMLIFVEDIYAGDLSKGGKYDGSKEKPYKLNCIEDLITWSNNYNIYEEKYIELERSLDFKSVFSYNDYTTVKYGDLNKDGKIESILDELTSNNGFTPIYRFSGVFNGNGNEIKNIYIKASANAAFVNVLSGEVNNLQLSGNIETTSQKYCGGVCAISNNAIVSNCINRCNIIGKDAVGGIVGYGNGKIENCKNYGNINSSGFSGGIVGWTQIGTMSTNNCYNEGVIEASNVSGGIVGIVADKIAIYNCLNNGKVLSQNYAGGILGCSMRGEIHIINCFNKEDIEATNAAGGIVGAYGCYYMSTIPLEILNCFNVGNINCDPNSGAIIGYEGGHSKNDDSYTINYNYYLENSAKFAISAFTDNIQKCTKEYMQSNEFVNELNNNIKNIVISDSNILLNEWTYMVNNYPSFK